MRKDGNKYRLLCLQPGILYSAQVFFSSHVVLVFRVLRGFSFRARSSLCTHTRTPHPTRTNTPPNFTHNNQKAGRPEPWQTELATRTGCQNRTARITTGIHVGQEKDDSQDRITRKGKRRQPGRDNRTGPAEHDRQNMTGRRAKTEPDRQNRTPRTGLSVQDCRNRAARTSRTWLPGQDCHDRAAREGLPGPCSQDRAARAELPGQGSQDRTSSTGLPGQDFQNEKTGQHC